jgi:predicted MFS family arabinose efflux permease
MYGPRPLYLAGTGLTGVAGLVGAFAPSLGVLIVARVLLGFGTCTGYPAAMSLIGRESKRTGVDSPASVLTVLTVSAQTIAVVGPTLGGLLIGLGGWRTIFTVNVPLSIAGLVLGAWRLPRERGSEADDAHPAGIDFAGIALFTGMLVALLLVLMEPRFWYVLGIAAAVGVALVVWERRAAQPFVDVRVLGGNRPLLATFGRNLLAYTVSYAFIYGYTQWLEDGRGLRASTAGLVLVTMFLTAIVVASVTGRRKEVWAKLVVGSVAQIAGCVALLVIHAHTAIWLLAGVALIVGVPQGLISLANQNALYYQADADWIASSAGLLRTFMYLGAMIAAAAGGGFFGARADTGGLHHLAVFMLAVAVVFLVFTLLDRSLRRVASTLPGGRDEARAGAAAA